MTIHIITTYLNYHKKRPYGASLGESVPGRFLRGTMEKASRTLSPWLVWK